MKVGKVLLLVVLLGCYLSNDAVAGKRSMRSVKNFFMEHSANVKQWGVSIVAACSLVFSAGCDPAITTKRHATTISYEDAKNISVEELIASLEQVGDTEFSLVRLNYHGMPTAGHFRGSTIFLQLLEGEILINNGDLPLKVILPAEEAVDEGWIADGSWIAIIPSAAIVAGMFYVTLLATSAIKSDGMDNYEVLTTLIVGLFGSGAAGIGSYHLITLL